MSVVELLERMQTAGVTANIVTTAEGYGLTFSRSVNGRVVANRLEVSARDLRQWEPKRLGRLVTRCLREHEAAR